MKNRKIIAFILILFILTGCIPNGRAIITTERGDKISVDVYNKSTMDINGKKQELTIWYSNYKFFLPFEVIDHHEMQKRLDRHSYFATYDHPSTISAKDETNEGTIYYWLIPVESETEESNEYWIYIEANLDQIGIKDYMLGIEDKDGVQSDDISWRVTAHMVTD